MAKRGKAAAVQPAGVKARYWREKIPRLVAQGRAADALAALDRFWPVAAPAARVAVLLDVWPERLAGELPDPLPADLAETLAVAPLLLEDAHFDALCRVPAVLPLAGELAAVREASVRLAAGETAAAREALAAIGLRSPLRHARMLVRALCALQEGADDEARRALATLAATPFERLAAGVTRALAGDDGVMAERLGLAAGGSSELAEVLALIAGPRSTEGLTRLTRLAPSLPPRIVRMLRRELLATLLVRDVAPEAVLPRIRRALGTDPDDPQDLRARALIDEHHHHAHAAAQRWLEAAKAVSKGAMWRGVDRTLARAALLCRAAQQRLADALHGEWNFSDELDEGVGAAAELFEHALALDSGRRDAWDGLREALDELGDRSAQLRLTERFAAAFPEDPDAQLAAATDYAARRSFVKAAAHAKRAAALAPHDPRIREVEADILVGRAFKQLAGGHRDAALATFRQAAAVPDRGRESRLRVGARVALAEGSFGDQAVAGRLRDELLAAGASAWLWTLHEADALREHVAAKHIPADYDVPPMPASPPSPGEIAAVLSWCDHARRRHQVTLQINELAATVAGYAVSVTALATLKLATQWAQGEAGLRLHEHAVALFPDDSELVVGRYHLALTLGRPARYFASAVAELEAAVDTVRERLLLSLDDEAIPAGVVDGIVRRALRAPGAPVDVLARVRELLSARAARAVPKQAGRHRRTRAGGR